MAFLQVTSLVTRRSVPSLPRMGGLWGSRAPVRPLATFPTADAVAGEVWSWGKGDDGQLGNAASDKVELSPRPVEALKGVPVVQVAAGQEFSMALTAEGEVYTWGAGKYGQLGHGDTASTKVPAAVEELKGKRVRSISAGGYHGAAVTENGEVFTWGHNGSFWSGVGGLGTGTGDLATPVNIDDLNSEKVVDVRCGGYHTACLTADNDVWVFGRGEFGRLGLGSASDVSAATEIDTLEPEHSIRAVTCGGEHTAFLLTNGLVYTTGKNDYGQLGHGDEAALGAYSMERIPRLVEGMESVSQIVCGNHATLLIQEDGQLTACGNRLMFAPKPVNSKEVNDKKAVRIAGGHMFSGVVTEDGALYMWGKGKAGQLGLGVKKNAADPEKVRAINNVQDISFGYRHALAVVQG